MLSRKRMAKGLDWKSIMKYEKFDALLYIFNCELILKIYIFIVSTYLYVRGKKVL